MIKRVGINNFGITNPIANSININQKQHVNAINKLKKNRVAGPGIKTAIKLHKLAIKILNVLIDILFPKNIGEVGTPAGTISFTVKWVDPDLIMNNKTKAGQVNRPDFSKFITISDDERGDNEV